MSSQKQQANPFADRPDAATSTFGNAIAPSDTSPPRASASHSSASQVVMTRPSRAYSSSSVSRSWTMPRMHFDPSPHSSRPQTPDSQGNGQRHSLNELHSFIDHDATTQSVPTAAGTPSVIPLDSVNGGGPPTLSLAPSPISSARATATINTIDAINLSTITRQSPLLVSALSKLSPPAATPSPPVPQVLSPTPSIAPPPPSARHASLGSNLSSLSLNRSSSAGVSPFATSALGWVSQSNRELVKLVFSKRTHMQRGLLEPRFQGVLSDIKASSSTSSKPNSSPNSSAAGASAQQLAAQLEKAEQKHHAATFNIAVFGTAGAGKSSTLYNLSGRTVPAKHMETAGLQLIDLSWPYRALDGAITICDFMLWDSGFSSSHQYKYIQSASESGTHCCLYIVSCLERASWLAVQRKLEDEDHSKPFAKLLILTKIDDRTKREVSDVDVMTFQDKFNQQYYGIEPNSSNTTPNSLKSPPPAGSLVVCKLANWPISNEPFFTRPAVASTLNTIAAMCIANNSQSK